MAPKPFLQLKALWLCSSALVLAVNLALLFQFRYFHKVSWLHYFAFSATLTTAVGIAPIALAALLSLIPFGSTSYRGRLAILWPVCYALTTFYSSWGVLNLAGTNMSNLSTISYDEGVAASASECFKVRDGKFEHPDFWIERKGDLQIEHLKRFGHTDTLRVQWLSSCEYRLRNPKDSEAIYRDVKIIAVTSEGYECLVTGIVFPMQETKRYELKRMK